MDKILLGDVFIRGGSSSGTHVLEEGRPIGQFYGLVCNGIDENGRYILVDKDGDGEISDPADYDYIGSAQPKLTTVSPTLSVTRILTYHFSCVERSVMIY